ncbi:DUF402 domain-containing protein [Streptomyces sp. NPDC005236]|uniref:DUF402 domain-containing protein n=1 Tax=Streptomyces sp. NPDC005236 TaxID=3157028 RepID=UPI00339F7E83
MWNRMEPPLGEPVHEPCRVDRPLEVNATARGRRPQGHHRCGDCPARNPGRPGMDSPSGAGGRRRRAHAGRVSGQEHAAHVRDPRVPLGPTPWGAFEQVWQSGGVLATAAREGHSVRARWEGSRFQGWYVNFQEPMRRPLDGFDTLDQELDLRIPGDGSPYRWKGVDEFEERCAPAASPRTRRCLYERRPPRSSPSRSEERAGGRCRATGGRRPSGRSRRAEEGRPDGPSVCHSMARVRLLRRPSCDWIMAVV